MARSRTFEGMFWVGKGPAKGVLGAFKVSPRPEAPTEPFTLRATLNTTGCLPQKKTSGSSCLAGNLENTLAAQLKAAMANGETGIGSTGF